MLLLNKFADNIEVKPLFFPDGTSQVWKLPLEKLEGRKNVVITWEYEYEAELIHLNQLIALLEHEGFTVSLDVPYLPYARQDKEIDNNLTFAKKIFLEMLNTKNVKQMRSRDVHSLEKVTRWESLSPCPWIYEIISRYSRDSVTIVFPDHGAKNRYQFILDDIANGCEEFKDYIVIDKVRDQQSGQITGLIVDKKESTFNFGRQKVLSNVPKFLIIDDICDGGRTFIETAKAIKSEVPKSNIWLFTTHGIYSKGLEPIFESGISRIFTTNSLSRFRANMPFDFSKLEVIEDD